jgi:hypothetical protein
VVKGPHSAIVASELARGEPKGKLILLRVAPGPKLTSIQVLQRLQIRVEKRMEALQRVKLEGFDMVLAELQVELDFLRRATRYLEEGSEKI